MSLLWRHPVAGIVPVVVLSMAVLLSASGHPSARTLSDRISDAEFSRLMTELSEEGGRFAQQLVSNEDSMEVLIPARMLRTFSQLGPGRLKGYGDRDNLPYGMLMAVTDLDGRERSFLATEDAYRHVRDLERRNLVVAVTGDFAGDKALTGIASYLEAHGEAVDVFYVANVERYLFGDGNQSRRFYRNVAALPLSPSAVFVRSLTRDISHRLGIEIPAAPTKWWTVVSPIRECLDGVAGGRIRTYGDLFAVVR